MTPRSVLRGGTVQLCNGSLHNYVVEYALRHLKRPIGVAQWVTSIVTTLPKELKGMLPTVEEIEARLAESPDEHKNRR